MRRVLKEEFFERPPLVVAKDLVGKFLVRKMGKREVALMITEVEAYKGPEDLASHARFGKTLRTAPMFERGGTIYIFFTYGMHHMLNLVTGKVGKPSAVLIRGAQLVEGTFRHSAESQNVPKIDGPGKLTKFLKIDKMLNHKMLGKKSALWVEDRGVKLNPKDIKKTPRIGISYAGEYVEKPWRFVLNKKDRR